MRLLVHVLAGGSFLRSSSSFMIRLDAMLLLWLSLVLVVCDATVRVLCHKPLCLWLSLLSRLCLIEASACPAYSNGEFGEFQSASHVTHMSSSHRHFALYQCSERATQASHESQIQCFLTCLGPAPSTIGTHWL